MLGGLSRDLNDADVSKNRCFSRQAKMSGLIFGSYYHKKTAFMKPFIFVKSILFIEVVYRINAAGGERHKKL
jgi:hypothetical protein